MYAFTSSWPSAAPWACNYVIVLNCLTATPILCCSCTCVIFVWQLNRCKVHLFNCSLMQISNQPIAWQLSTFRHVDVIKMSCCGAWHALQLGRKVTLNVALLLVPDELVWASQKLLIYWDCTAMSRVYLDWPLLSAKNRKNEGIVHPGSPKLESRRLKKKKKVAWPDESQQKSIARSAWIHLTL